VASKKKHKKISSSRKQQVRKENEEKQHVRKRVVFKPVVPGRWTINAFIFFLFVIVTLILYSGDLRLGFFAVDDPQYVTNNPWIRDINAKNLNFILSEPYFANFSPMHLFSYMLDYSIGGADAYIFHFSSNLWAGIVAGFVYLVGFALTGNRIVAIGSAVLFVVHPVHVEAVAWISSRKDLVAAAFALPSLLAYMQYRRGGKFALRWYLLSLVLFLFAVSGKLSVATFPIVFLALDLFVEKRPFLKSLPDKIPFIIAATAIAMVVASTQPQMGNQPDAFVLVKAAIQNLWLLSGFGNYVLYREAPEPGGSLLQLTGIVLLLLLFAAPLLLRRRLPMIAVLIYWMLFAFIPSQILSFTHPVTDRYLFFPSVAFVIMIAWGIVRIFQKLGKRAVLASAILILVIAFFWTRTTIVYLNEWKDPRSVWFAAAKKSTDPAIPQNLGSFYVDLSRRFGSGTQPASISREEKERLASLIWVDDSRLPKLLSEWASGQQGGTIEKEFQEQIRSLAMDAFGKALQTKGNRVMPGIYYNRGSILLDRGDLENAKQEFHATLEEVSKESFGEVRQQLTVYSYVGLGISEWKGSNYTGAKDWFIKADNAQRQYGANWLPGLANDIKKLEQIIASQVKQ